MQSKSLLIAIAAFAVTATGVHAYGGAKVFNRAGINKDQVDAIEQAQRLRASGDHLAARDRLAEAGITEDTLRSIHSATVEVKKSIHDAIDTGDYQAFRETIADLPLADIITTEADFIQFKEAHALRQKGLLRSLAVPDAKYETNVGKKYEQHKTFEYDRVKIDFSEDQREALRVARQANDRATIQAIFDEAGVEHYARPKR
jgi:hypothetical protein